MTVIIIDELSNRLDEMADLCEHWRRWREKGNRRPQAIRAALVMLAQEIVMLDSQERGGNKRHWLDILEGAPKRNKEDDDA